MLSDRSFDTGEVLLHYVEAPASGPPLLLLHGLTGWLQAWEPIIPLLMSSWHVFACDLRGHGKSGRVDGQYQLVDYARDIAAFLNDRFDAPVVLVGHSLGALTAIAVAAQTPNLVRALVLLDPPLFSRNRSLAAMTSAYDWFSWVHATLKSSPSHDEIATHCSTVLPGVDEAVAQIMADQLSCVDISTVTVALEDELLETWDLGDALQKITCPTLLIRGDWDHGAAVDDDDAAYTKVHMPQIRDVKILEGSHLFPWEQADLTIEHVRSFLQTL